MRHFCDCYPVTYCDHLLIQCNRNYAFFSLQPSQSSTCKWWDFDEGRWPLPHRRALLCLLKNQKPNDHLPLRCCFSISLQFTSRVCNAVLPCFSLMFVILVLVHQLTRILHWLPTVLIQSILLVKYSYIPSNLARKFLHCTKFLALKSIYSYSYINLPSFYSRLPYFFLLNFWPIFPICLNL